MMINRQRALLRLIANESGKIDKLRLVKLAFLLRNTSVFAPKSNLYEFVPYHYGPYSFTLRHELRAMERDGWLRILDGEVNLLRHVGVEVSKLEGRFATEVDGLSRRYRNVLTTDLVSGVYQKYPWYTVNARDKNKRAIELPVTACAVFTVGYEGLMLDGLLDLLLTSGIKRLIDVRCNPIARRFGFHKSTLERHCLDLGLAYTHVPELGIPSNKRYGLIDSKSYDRLFKYYEESILPSQKAAIGLLSSLITSEPSALMCMEADSDCCHRMRLARVISKNTGLPVRELRDQCSQASLIPMFSSLS
jgi:uncharacterized protein (DUF488 family)